MNASIMHQTFGNDEFFTLKLYALHDKQSTHLTEEPKKGNANEQNKKIRYLKQA
ncbi:hypothetical protein J5A70_10965 [Prevotella nigrescens]|uniref:hypothetical protein n=1 Tax=Prevotella nigrescens TaxID=28133 RepID=UPI001BA45750|nr:hypothetical protein [Prevotella nigrescens]QUB50066.1 hypothetical protein J5A70_10965 [Prevotella nigrescens]